MFQQIRSVCSVRRTNLQQFIERTSEQCTEQIKSLEDEYKVAEVRYPNRTVRIREIIAQKHAEIERNNAELVKFDHTCEAFLQRASSEELEHHEIQHFYDFIGVVGNFHGPKNVSSSIHHHPNRTRMDYICTHCDEQRIFDEFEAFAVCPKCGDSVPYQRELYEVDEGMNYTIQFEYERQTHLREYINQIVKAEENASSVPMDIIRGIKRQILKERITDRSVITPRRVNNWLKNELNKSKYAEKKWSILFIVCKVRPPNIPATLVDKFFEMFAQVERAFAKHVPPGRIHFFNYGYILRKFSELLDQRHLLTVFTVLKGTDRVHFQDDIWKKCCAELGWKFIPSI
jgi:hypothetical protein